MSNWAVLVAAGQGQRAGLGMNKAFWPLCGRSMLSRCLDALTASDLFEGIVLVLAESEIPAYQALAQREGACPLVQAIVAGGATRQRSALNGLRATPARASVVAIHDAARPLVPTEVIRATVDSAERLGSGVAATVLTDTVKQVDASLRVVQTLNREILRAVQTPQAFRRALLLEAHERAEREGVQATDDAALVEKYFGEVHLVVSDAGRKNIKLTTREDLQMMERMLTAHPRIGQGLDAHRLVPGRKLVLCGVEIPSDQGLDGHSDADVATHALMDALLGAAGLGDIGRHFPDTEAQYLGISSLALLERVVFMLRARAYAVLNADVTIVAQAPRLSPHMAQMCHNLARVLGIEEDRVNVKATTTERMGYEGRHEGISASAVAMIASGN